jgi:flagellar hook-associated protein 3 FlgL
MRLSTSWMYQQSTNTMLNQQSAVAASQNQVSTGKRINVASDDPAGAGQVVSINHVLATNTQYSTNIDSATTKLSTEQTALTSVGSLLDSARTLALQGINGSLGSSDRQAMATQLAQMRDQLVQQANTTDANGNALFAGTSTTTVPFVKNADGSVNYTGNDGQQMTSIGSGLQTAIGDSGAQVFMAVPAGNGSFTSSADAANTGTLLVGENSVTDPTVYAADSAANGGSYTLSFDGSGNWSATDASGNPVLDSSGNPVTGTYSDPSSISFNGMTIALSGTPATGDTVSVKSGGTQDVFTTLNTMIAALQGNGSGTQISNTLSRSIESIDQAQQSVTNTEVAIGGRMNTLSQQKTAYQDLAVTYQSSLSNVQDVDAYTAISNLSTQTAALQASQQLFSQVKSMSLFNYLK